MRITLWCLVLVLVVAASENSAIAQRETATGIEVEKDLQLLRRDIRVEKKKIIAVNLPLTENEATRFWPIYDQYANEMSKQYDQFYSVIKDYAANQKTLTDPQAVEMIERWSSIQVQVAQTRQKYIPIIEKVLPGKKTALFFQIDRRLFGLMDLQVASEIPLILQ